MGPARPSTPHCVFCLQRVLPARPQAAVRTATPPCAGGPEPPGAAAGEDEGLGSGGGAAVHRQPRSLYDDNENE